MINVSKLQDRELDILAEGGELFKIVVQILEAEKEKIHELTRKDRPSDNILDISYQLRQSRYAGVIDAIADISKLGEYSKKEKEKRTKLLHKNA
jgi:methyl coenzyme M reductase subunit D